MDRIRQLLDFLQEIEKFKYIERHIYLQDGRRESDAEHSWHLAMFLLLFEKNLPPNLDFLKMVKMALIHDLCEIYAGDVLFYDDKGREGKSERELDAAQKLFKQLPDDLQTEFMQLFHEYEEKKTKEALLVNSFDKLQPILQNIGTHGLTWKKLNITYDQLHSKKKIHMDHDNLIKDVYEQILKEIKEKKLL